MRIDNRGIGLEVDVDGPADGPPVVLLHGISSCAATYDFLVPELPAHRLYRLDFRGHGRSDRAPGRYTVDDYASDAVAVLEQLAGGPAVVVGHSLGGITAAHVANLRPELLTAVLLEDPPLFFGDKAVFDATPFAVVFPLIRAAIDQWHADGADAEVIAAAVAGMPSMTGRGPIGEEIEPDALSMIGVGFVALDTAVYDPVLAGEAVSSFDVERPIPVPGVLLQPDRELGAAFFDDHAAALAATSPAIEIVRMHDVGHLIHDSRTHRAAYVDEVRRFLATYAPA